MGIGIQHEILPRLSGEFTWNYRKYGNITVSDQLQVGCDRYNGATDATTCQQGYLDYVHPNYDFYSVVAPSDPRLPNGGNYRITGLNTADAAIPTTTPTAQTILPELGYDWSGFDTNFVWRGPRGLRVNGGTSTGRTNRDTCFATLDGPDSKGREGAEYLDGCLNYGPWQTRVNGTAAYVIPWVDVLVSTVFQSFPGVEYQATMTYNKDQLIWDSNPSSQDRVTMPCAVPANGFGCTGSTGNGTTAVVNLVNNNEIYGDRVTLFDLKVAKNIRFANKRATIGVDIYNLFNSDAVEAYNANYTIDNPATEANENLWGTPTTLVSARFVRIQVQFNW
jgi:hypothetical protein